MHKVPLMEGDCMEPPPAPPEHLSKAEASRWSELVAALDQDSGAVMDAAVDLITMNPEAFKAFKAKRREGLIKNVATLLASHSAQVDPKELLHLLSMDQKVLMAATRCVSILSRAKATLTVAEAKEAVGLAAAMEVSEEAGDEITEEG
jgi:hypothetical protein